MLVQFVGRSLPSLRAIRLLPKIIIIIIREERIFKRIFPQRILSFSRQIDRIGHDDEGDARDTGGPLRPRGQPLLGGRRQSATCCTNIVQGHRAPAARG